jgi:hypothetical protein
VTTTDDSIEEIIYKYVYVSGEVSFRRLLSFIAQHTPFTLRRDRVALVLGSMASEGKISVKKVGAEWKISPKKTNRTRRL